MSRGAPPSAEGSDCNAAPGCTRHLNRIRRRAMIVPVRERYLRIPGMKVFVIRGAPSVSPSDTASQQSVLSTSMERLGRELAASGHEILVCSPFPDSADLAVVRGAASFDPERAIIEFHCPDAETIR